MRRLLNELRQLQSDRWLRAEVLRDGFDEKYIGIADTHHVIKGLADNERLKSQFFMAPFGIDPINQTNRTQSVGQALSPANRDPDPSCDPNGAVRPVAPAVFPAGKEESQPLPSLVSDARPLNVPRNAPCPCHSGLKYKRCCGTTAPPVLGACARS
jgi:hypothetical protein